MTKSQETTLAIGVSFAGAISFLLAGTHAYGNVVGFFSCGLLGATATILHTRIREHGERIAELEKLLADIDANKEQEIRDS